MKINTTRFGELEIDENRIFDFELPIIGFNEFTKFIMLDLSKDKFFKWLQSVEEPSLAFPVVSVFSLGVDYSIDLPDDVVEKLQIENVESLKSDNFHLVVSLILQTTFFVLDIVIYSFEIFVIRCCLLSAISLYDTK